MYKYIREKREEIFIKLDSFLSKELLEEIILNKGLKMQFYVQKITNYDNNDFIYSNLDVKNQDLFDLGIMVYKLYSGREIFMDKEEIESGMYELEIRDNTSQEIIDFIRTLLKYDHGDLDINKIEKHNFLKKDPKEYSKVNEKYPKIIYCSIYTEEINFQKIDGKKQKMAAYKEKDESIFPSFADQLYLDSIYWSHKIILTQENHNRTIEN